jgi:hypothetical protein
MHGSSPAACEWRYDNGRASGAIASSSIAFQSSGAAAEKRIIDFRYR